MSEGTSRKTILVLAYSVSPVRGSEFAVGWNYIKHMSRDHDLIVLYGVAGEFMGDFEEMSEVTLPGVDFVPVMPGRLARLLDAPNRARLFGPAFYFAYRVWQHQALHVARQICVERNIDIVHFLCPIGYREPGLLGKLNLPYIWGPIGGMKLRPFSLIAHMGIADGLTTALRNAVNWLQFRYSPRVRAAMIRPDVLITNTSENVDLIRRVHGRDPHLMPENGVDSLASQPPHGCNPGTRYLVWVGRIDTAKALDFLIEALGQIRPDDWFLDIVGDGPRRPQLEARASELGLANKIRWHGKLPREHVLALYKNADIHILTSLAEAHSTVVWEAMGNGIPTVTFDHCGMHDTICDQCGIRIPVTIWENMVTDLAENIRRLVMDRSEVLRLKCGARLCAKSNSWESRRQAWNRFYDLALERFSACDARKVARR